MNGLWPDHSEYISLHQEYPQHTCEFPNMEKKEKSILLFNLHI